MSYATSAAVLTFVVLSAALSSCTSSDFGGPPVQAHVLSVALVDQEGLVIRYDLESDGRPLRLLVTPIAEPRTIVASLDRLELGVDRRTFVERSALGAWVHDWQSLEVSIVDEKGVVYAKRRAQ